MTSEKFWLKSGFVAAAMATTAWVALPVSAQETEEETTEEGEPVVPDVTGTAVSEAAKTLKDLPPEERAAFAKTLREIAQENLPEVALENRPEQAGKGPLNKPETAGQPTTTPSVRPTTAGRPNVRPSAASRPQRPVRPSRPGRGRN